MTSAAAISREQQRAQCVDMIDRLKAVPSTAGPATIRKMLQRASLMCHPDKGGDCQMQVCVNFHRLRLNLLQQIDRAIASGKVEIPSVAKYMGSRGLDPKDTPEGCVFGLVTDPSKCNYMRYEPCESEQGYRKRGRYDDNDENTRRPTGPNGFNVGEGFNYRRKRETRYDDMETEEEKQKEPAAWCAGVNTQGFPPWNPPEQPQPPRPEYAPYPPMPPYPSASSRPTTTPECAAQPATEPARPACSTQLALVPVETGSSLVEGPVTVITNYRDRDTRYDEARAMQIQAVADDDEMPGQRVPESRLTAGMSVTSNMSFGQGQEGTPCPAGGSVTSNMSYIPQEIGQIVSNMNHDLQLFRQDIQDIRGEIQIVRQEEGDDMSVLSTPPTPIQAVACTQPRPQPPVTQIILNTQGGRPSRRPDPPEQTTTVQPIIQSFENSEGMCDHENDDGYDDEYDDEYDDTQEEGDGYDAGLRDEEEYQAAQEGEEEYECTECLEAALAAIGETDETESESVIAVDGDCEEEEEEDGLIIEQKNEDVGMEQCLRLQKQYPDVIVCNKRKREGKSSGCTATATASCNGT